MTPKDYLKFPILFAVLILISGSLSGCMSATGGNYSSVSAEEAVADDPGVQEPAKSSKTDDLLEVEIGIEPTPFPETHFYTQSEYGFEFEYPETWSLSEADHGVILQKGARQLTIRFRWRSELPPSDFQRSGMPAGDLVYRGKLNLFDQTIPVDHLVSEGDVKMVLYNEGQAIETGELQLVVTLEDLNTAYEEIAFSPETISDASSILESFRRVEGEGSPPAVAEEGICAAAPGDPPQNWERYQNEEYGFYFSHPPGLEITDLVHLIMVRDGDLTMQVKYRRIDEQISMTGKIPEGDVELVRFETYFGEEDPNPIVVEKSEGKINRVSVGNLITSTTPVQFLVSLTSNSGQGIDMDQADGLLEIVDYLCINP